MELIRVREASTLGAHEECHVFPKELIIFRGNSARLLVVSQPLPRLRRSRPSGRPFRFRVDSLTQHRSETLGSC